MNDKRSSNLKSTIQADNRIIILSILSILNYRTAACTLYSYNNSHWNIPPILEDLNHFRKPGNQSREPELAPIMPALEAGAEV